MARRFYNGSARDLKIMVDRFPSNQEATHFDFTQFDFVELDPAESIAVKQVPTVNF